MIVSQRDIEQIGGRMRRRVLQLPVRRGRFGELKRCPLRRGGTYRLRHSVPYDQYLEEALGEPSRARGVVRLLVLCEIPVRSVTVTVTGVERQGEEWIVRFEKGEHPDMFDRDVFLARHNDFTMDESRQTVRGDPPLCAPLAEDLRRARRKAREKREEPNRSDIAAMREAHKRMALRRHTMTVEARRQLDRAGKAIDRLAELSVGGDAILPVSDRGQGPEARELNADTEQSARAVVSLEPAA